MIDSNHFLIYGNAESARWRQFLGERATASAEVRKQVGDGRNLCGQHKRLTRNTKALTQAGKKYQLNGHAAILGTGAIVNSFSLQALSNKGSQR